MSDAHAHAAPPTQVILAQPTAFGRYGRYLGIALALALFTIVGQAASYRSYFSSPDAPQERYHSLDKSAEEKIAIVTIAGAILEGDGFVKRQIDRIREDKSVKAVVLRIDSPGGTVTGSDYLYHHLQQLKSDRDLPIVVSMGSICASGGYYIAMAVGNQADSLFAEPSTWTGSIGVVIPHYDLSGLLSEWKVEDDSIASHKYKLMGSPTRELDPEGRSEERALLQELVDRSFDRFKEIVKTGRPKLADDEGALAKATTGQIFTAQQALDLGLIDKIGFVETAIERAAELAGHDPKSLRCIKYDAPSMTLSTLLSSEAVRPANVRATGWDLSRLFDLTAPRAYYLCSLSWLPSLLNNQR